MHSTYCYANCTIVAIYHQFTVFLSFSLSTARSSVLSFFLLRSKAEPKILRLIQLLGLWFYSKNEIYWNHNWFFLPHKPNIEVKYEEHDELHKTMQKDKTLIFLSLEWNECLFFLPFSLPGIIPMDIWRHCTYHVARYAHFSLEAWSLLHRLTIWTV